MFPSEKLSAPAGKDNVWRRHIIPKLRTTGLEWISFQVMRRTHSTLMNKLKIDPRTVADQLGHTVDVNQNVYTLRRLEHCCLGVRIQVVLWPLNRYFYFVAFIGFAAKTESLSSISAAWLAAGEFASPH